MAVANAHSAVRRIANELDSIKRLSAVAIAAASYGVDKADVIARSERIIKRAALLQQVSNSRACINKIQINTHIHFTVRLLAFSNDCTVLCPGNVQRGRHPQQTRHAEGASHVVWCRQVSIQSLSIGDVFLLMMNGGRYEASETASELAVR